MKQHISAVLFALCLLGAVSLRAAAAPDLETMTISHTFSGSMIEYQPDAGNLTSDNHGDLIGLDYNGGKYQKGCVYEIQPDGSWVDLYDFGMPGTNGFSPINTPIVDDNGNLYGACEYTSESNLHSALFMMTRNSNNTYNAPFVSNQFAGTYGAIKLSWARGSNEHILIGTASQTWYDNNLIFELNASPQGFSNYHVVHTFSGSSDGKMNISSLTPGIGESLLGTACSYNTDDSIIFKLQPGRMQEYDYSVVHTFSGKSTDGLAPFSGLTADASGQLFGTTCYGGSHGFGTVYRLTYSRSSRGYLFQTIYSFGNSGDGICPYGRVYVSHSGNLYGLTSAGGRNSQGTLYELLRITTIGPTQALAGSTNYLESILCNLPSTSSYVASGSLTRGPGNEFYASLPVLSQNHGEIVRFGPTVTQVLPAALNSVPVSNTTLTVEGTGFNTQDFIYVNGTSLQPTQYNAGELAVSVPPTVWHTGSNSVGVYDPVINSYSILALPIDNVILRAHLQGVTTQNGSNQIVVTVANYGLVPALSTHILGAMLVQGISPQPMTYTTPAVQQLNPGQTEYFTFNVPSSTLSRQCTLYMTVGCVQTYSIFKIPVTLP